tara:strand:+ start:88846 stop:90954 length:2109 start_codon:yes stop_codon:yes gene_type:complete
VEVERVEDGYDAWLRYVPVTDQKVLNAYQNEIDAVAIYGDSPTMNAIFDEFSEALPKLLSKRVSVQKGAIAKGEVVVSTPANSEWVSDSITKDEMDAIGDEGYIIKKVSDKILITANTDIGLLYGSFAFLREIQTGQPIDNIAITSAPKVKLRMLNHWDNLNRVVERGYAGLSIWDWGRLPEYNDPRYTDYARLTSSLGLNGTVVNNVNADPRMLSDQFLNKLVTIAGALRPYGIKVFISINYQAPIRIGGLKTADPLNEEVKEWWAKKADEIYALIPDFGGFLVKADSEGQPGPFKYGRDHAQGANVLADALAPHGSMVIWRAFVYSPEQYDRFREAFDEFTPLDGKFRDNVLLQVKNGPIDFQPREPFSPLFGAMKQTNTMLELQITQEYFGFANHLAYMGPLYEEVLDTDTYAEGEGSTVGKVISGEIFGYDYTGMAGVVNLGTDRNWTGHPFVQSSWYAFGRLAWDYTLPADEIAEEWIRMTFSNDQEFISTVKDMMMNSREAGVNYRMPLGLTHLYAQGHHYGPAPWTVNLPRPDWTAVYYHKADKEGIGFDRTKTGSNAIEQYNEPLKTQFSSPETTPEELLLWFHHLSWDHEMNSGNTLWEELVHKYYAGVDEIRTMQKQWDSVKDHMDERRYHFVKALLEIQERDAVRWRNSSVLYFQSFSNRPIPDGLEKPEHDLNYYIGLEKTEYIPDPWYN